MPTLILLLILLSVGMISAGQILFKVVGLNLAKGVSFLDWRVAGVAVLAFGIYGLATLLWIYILRTTPLTKAYPYMALSFVIVPAVSVLLFSEQVKAQYVVGVVLVVTGVILTSLSGKG